MKTKKLRLDGTGIFNILNAALMLLFSIIIIVPIWTIVVQSFTAPDALSSSGLNLFPTEFSLENYKIVFADDSIWTAFGVSIIKTIIGVVAHVLFTSMVAYGMSKSYLKGRKIYTTLGLITMFISAGMIPTFLLIQSLGLLNSFWVYIIPALFSYYDMIILMNFFREVPESLEESARIDGANTWTIFTRIVLPLSKPVLCTIGLFHGVYQWNDYMTAKLYINNEALYPIQMKLYEIIISQTAQTAASTSSSVVIETTAQSIQLATIVIATLPIILVYPFLQKHFLSGMMIGAVKE